MLKIKNLSLVKSRGAVLKNINLEIPKGQTTLLLGKSGSGKTSLLRCTAQLEKYQGEIVYEGKLGFVPQAFTLFPHMTVLENCVQPMRLQGLPEEKAVELLETLQMLPYADRKPAELSGGQQQRAAIARALGLDPDFLLLDEPTSALDPENTEIMIGLVEQLKSAGKGIVISSQDMPFAEKIKDQVVFLENGELIENCERLKSFLDC